MPVELRKTATNIVFMPDAEDDRVQALSWYCRRLILDELNKGIKQAELGRRARLTRSTINQAKKPQGVGLSVALKLAEYFRLSDAGELMSRALEWWENVGRQEAADELARRAREAAESAVRERKKAAKGKRGRPAKPPIRVVKS